MIQKISDWISKTIGFDGLLHFAVCAIMTALIKAIAEPLLAALVVATISIEKEFYDMRTNKGCAEFKDLVCDLAGILIGVL